MCAINDHKLIGIIVKSVNIQIHFIFYRKSFLPAYAQLGMLGTIFAMLPVVALTATVPEQTKCYSGALAARKGPPSGAPYSSCERKGNP